MAMYSIVNGPSKWDMMLALFDNTAASPRHIIFEIGAVGPSFRDAKIVVNSIEREDGSGESWSFRGYAHKADGSLPTQCNVSGYYSTRTRKGSMRIEPY